MKNDFEIENISEILKKSLSNVNGIKTGYFLKH